MPSAPASEVTLMIRPLDALPEGLKGMERALRPVGETPTPRTARGENL
jgi:hypothetical protein